MMPKIKPMCRTCAFHGQALDSDWFVCRRHPPVAPANEPDRSAAFPMIGRDGWCGDYRFGAEGVAKCR